jgi:hypothetical protein
VEFRRGFLERIPLGDATTDIVTSNCVINLSPDKPAVFREIWRVLRDYGRAVIADIVADTEVPPRMRADGQLWGECISGALSEDAFLAAFERAGFYGISILKKTFWREVEGTSFHSVTVRGYKLAGGTRAVAHAGAPHHPVEGPLQTPGQQHATNHRDHRPEVADHGRVALGGAAAMHVAIPPPHGAQHGSEIGARGVEDVLPEGGPPGLVPNEARENIASQRQARSERGAHGFLSGSDVDPAHDLSRLVEARQLRVQGSRCDHGPVGAANVIFPSFGHGGRLKEFRFHLGHGGSL